LAFKIASPRGIFIGLPAMLTAVDFDNELCGSRDEIANEGADWNLSIEAHG
jgi:hypothetical protein